MSSLLTGGANAERRKALLDMLSDEVFQRGLLRGAANIVPGIARGISADLLGGPVDMVTAALNVPAGLLGKKIENPVGGSEWIGQKMEQAGLLSPQTGHPAETVSRLAGGLLASPQVVGRVGSAVENVAQGMAQNAMMPRTLHPQTGAIVYHGTPHRFAPEPDAPLGRFRSDKIGTGEGAQAYGHGLYFAEHPNVAKEYSRMSPSVDVPVRRAFRGQELEPGTWEYKAASLLDGGKSLQSVRKELAGWIKNASPGEDVQGYQKALDLLTQAESKTDFKKLKHTGSLYKVDLPDEAIAKMLDWDKPLSQQSEVVRNALKKALEKNPSMTGEQLYRKFAIGDTSRPHASETLKEYGIPGIRYLDQGSRGAGQGTYNYVVFPGEEGLLRILGRE